MSQASAILARVRNLIVHEPAAVIGAAVTVLLAVQDVVVNQHITDWRNAVPVIVAAVIRQFVTPASDPKIPVPNDISSLVDRGPQPPLAR